MGKTLEAIVNVAKTVKEETWDKVDDFFLRQYTRLAQFCEKHANISKYHLAAIFDLYAFSVLMGHNGDSKTREEINPSQTTFHLRYDLDTFPIICFAFSFGISVADSLGQLILKDEYSQFKKNNRGILDSLFQTISNFRLPLLATGAYLLTGIDDSITQFLGFDYMKKIVLGNISVAIASSMYIKSSDPEILDRETIFSKFMDSTRKPAQALERSYKALKENTYRLPQITYALPI